MGFEVTRIDQKSMRQKNTHRPLLVAALAICICFIANSATPYGVNPRPVYPSAFSQQRVVPGDRTPLSTAASIATLDLSSSDFTASRGARLAESREARLQKERSDSESLVLIGLGFMLFGCAIFIRRGSTA